jgi:hypothetical protein
VRWDDFPSPIQQRLTAAGLEGATFSAAIAARQTSTLARVREGDLDAAIYYALQSTTFTSLAPIEPALSARAFVESLDDATRRRFLSGEDVDEGRIPASARARLDALASAKTVAAPFSRLAYVREIVRRDAASPPGIVLRREYVRAMRFLYQKEFVAPREGGALAVEALYQARGLSTDTAVEAGYLVHLGLATLQAAEPQRRVRRVLIIGPGLDLAPRTALIEAGPPESYQPYAVIDALLSVGLSRLDDLVVAGGDVNPRVVSHLEGARTRTVSLTLVTGVGDAGAVSLQDDYRRYVDGVGRSIGAIGPAPKLPSSYDGHLRKSIRVRPDVTAVVNGLTLDVAASRIEPPGFDLVIATNVLPYLDDTALTMAMANMAAMLAPGGVLLHNESRPLMATLGAELGLPITHARTATIATVRGAPPLADAVFMHEKR